MIELLLLSTMHVYVCHLLHEHALVDPAVIRREYRMSRAGAYVPKINRTSNFVLFQRTKNFPPFSPLKAKFLSFEKEDEIFFS